VRRKVKYVGEWCSVGNQLAVECEGEGEEGKRKDWRETGFRGREDLRWWWGVVSSTA
jgi:hypothetical protein